MKVALFVLVVAAVAVGENQYQSATLSDLQMVEGSRGYGRAGQTFCLAVSTDDLSYLLHYGPIWAYGYAPDFVVGDTVQIRIKGNTAYLKKPKSGELKTQIVRRERKSPDKSQPNCGEAVTVRH